MAEDLFGLDEPSARLFKEMADDFRQRLPDRGRRTRRVGLNITVDPTVNTTSCGPCVYGAGAMTIDLGSGFMASETYQALLFCENIDPIIYSGYSAGPPKIWTGTADPMTVDCNGTDVTWTSSLTYFSHLPGDGSTSGIVVAWSDGTNTWKWINRTSWQPDLRTELELHSGPAECPCAPFIDFPCLVPIPTPA